MRPIIYEDDYDIIVEPSARTLADGEHIGCGGCVDRYESSKNNRTILHCRKCSLRVIENDTTELLDNALFRIE